MDDLGLCLGVLLGHAAAAQTAESRKLFLTRLQVMTQLEAE